MFVEALIILSIFLILMHSPINDNIRIIGDDQ